jgi:hypothetical protein
VSYQTTKNISIVSSDVGPDCVATTSSQVQNASNPSSGIMARDKMFMLGLKNKFIQ